MTNLTEVRNYAALIYFKAGRRAEGGFIVRESVLLQKFAECEGERRPRVHVRGDRFLLGMRLVEQHQGPVWCGGRKATVCQDGYRAVTWRPWELWKGYTGKALPCVLLKLFLVTVFCNF
ncbi:hypothetical protein HHUSO_G18704 [Huso huso]|uniref:Uncharacterized protein n=1 Tax=Huso huso TaxID=61971 RepID=A0ABR0Z5A4_HUSHU